MVGSGSRNVSYRTRSKKNFNPENPSARKLKNNDDDEKKEIGILDLSSSESEPEHENGSEKEKEQEEEDSDEEEIRLLFDEKLAALNVEKVAPETGLKNEKRGGSSRSSSGNSTGKEVEKKKNKGKMKEVVEEERRGEKEMTNLKKKKVVVEEEDESEREEGLESKFFMNRILKIMKDQDSSARLAEEALFLANKASEKFLELYCTEAYACAFLDHKKQLSYDHLGPPADWAAIEKFAHAMKVRQQQELAKHPSNPQITAAAEDKSSEPKLSPGLKRQKTENALIISSMQEYSSAAAVESSKESPLPSALDTVSGLKLMSHLQSMNMLSFEMISRRNTRQILKNLEDEPDEPAANTTSRRAPEAEAESPKDGPGDTAVWALLNL